MGINNVLEQHYAQYTPRTDPPPLGSYHGMRTEPNAQNVAGPEALAYLKEQARKAQDQSAGRQFAIEVGGTRYVFDGRDVLLAALVGINLYVLWAVVM